MLWNKNRRIFRNKWIFSGESRAVFWQPLGGTALTLIIRMKRKHFAFISLNSRSNLNWRYRQTKQIVALVICMQEFQMVTACNAIGKWRSPIHEGTRIEKFWPWYHHLKIDTAIEQMHLKTLAGKKSRKVNEKLLTRKYRIKNNKKR